jgi:hypothetical protein
MVKVFILGRMEHSILENGSIIRHKEKESLFMQMEMFMKVIGIKIRLMDLESILIQMGPSTKVSGRR